MFKFLPGVLRGSLIVILVWINIILLCIPLYIFAFLRFISPQQWKPALSRSVNRVAELWISTNNLIFDQFQTLDIQIKGMPPLEYNNWYLVISNHQTWMDIVILQRIFNRRIPMLKFFIKEQLIWIPVIGIAWWALDFPVMKRYSREVLAKKPHLRGRDLKTTLASCEKFKLTPVSVLNFMEGTRFTIDKHRSQKSPFNNLLRPKTGGVAMVIDSLNDQLAGILDVTILYPDGVR
ncbi:MAG: acetyltransferase, partial [Gammaproteobacteria bacterium]|nr:acetyltransferase [Gammaproteobacteria bacterium]